MASLYLIFSVLVFVMIIIFKKPRTTIFLSAISVLLLQSDSLIDGFFRIISIISQYFISYNFVLLLIFIVLIFLISELLVILNLTNTIENYIIKKGPKTQALYVHIISVFSSNFDFSKSQVVNKNNKELFTNSYLAQALNLFSIENIIIFIYISVILNQSTLSTLLLIAITNFFAIFWFIKIIIDIKLKKTNKIKTDYQIIVSNVNSVNHKVILIRYSLYVIIALISSFVLDINILFQMVFVSLVILIDLIINLEVSIYKDRAFSEMDVINSLKVSSKRFIGEITYLLVGSFYLLVMSEWTRTNGFLSPNGVVLVVLLITCLGMFFVYFLKNINISLILVLPFLALINWGTLVHSTSYTALYFMLGSIIFVEHLLVNHFYNSKIREILDNIVLLVAACISYFILFFTQSMLYSYLSLGIILILYAIVIYFRKDAYENS